MPTRTVTRLVSRNRGAEWASSQNADVAAARLPTRTASLQALFPIEAHERPESTLRAGVATAATVPLTQINDYQSLRCRATHKRPHQVSWSRPRGRPRSPGDASASIDMPSEHRCRIANITQRSLIRGTRYKRPPRKKKAAPLKVPAIVRRVTAPSNRDRIRRREEADECREVSPEATPRRRSCAFPARWDGGGRLTQ
jgi:hypothetical protein